MLLASVFTAALACCATSRADENVWTCGSSYGNAIFVPSAPPDMSATQNCPAFPQSGGGLVLQNGLGNVSQGQSARWQATAPNGLLIVGAAVPSLSVIGVNDNAQYGGGFYWQGGGAAVSQYELNALVGDFSSPYFGVQLICGDNTCTNQAHPEIQVGDIELVVRESVAPSLNSPSGLWQSSGWVRGGWPVVVTGDSPSGLCSLAVSLNSAQVASTTSPQDVSTWHQCAAPQIDQAVDTSRYGQGAVPLTLSAGDAAGMPASITRTVYIDNQQPSVALSGPADAPSTAGTQYVTAMASAGPSGVAGISCAVDGAPAQWYPETVAQVPVDGIGQHLVQCFSESNAVDGNGTHGTSTPQSFAIMIGAPTVTAIAFSRIVDQLRCHRVSARVRTAGRSVTVRRLDRRVKAHRGGRTKSIKVVKCHARTVRRLRTVWTTVRRRGKRVRIRRRELVPVVVLPRVVQAAQRRVGHGRATTVNGWLGTSSGEALPGQAIQVLAAADDGRGLFRSVAVATTAADGSWTAKLPAGPSRLVEATYAGGVDVEPSLSGVVHEVVPADVRLQSVRPHQVPWGGTIRLVGRLRGGYLPSGGALVRMRIGLGSTFTTYGVHEHVGGDGRFSTSYTFGVGDPSVRRAFWFQIASLPMGNYPYAPASSRRISVIVGGHPAQTPGQSR